MSTLTDHINELKVTEAFTKQSEVFDSLYADDAIIQYKRQRVRKHILQYANENDLMLELNCGTGEDAMFFAGKGYKVYATDISPGMLDKLKLKVEKAGFENRIRIEQCSFTELQLLQGKQTFDYIYSNFGGLNCTAELKKVLHSFDTLLKPGGVITLVVISKFCLWETLLLFKGKFETAFRRFFADQGRQAHVEGDFFKCWYYSSSFIKRELQDNYEFLSLEGLCTIIPPSYIENFAGKHPHLFHYLKKQEDKLKKKWPWNRMGDYFIISFRRK
jgi:ubiquinone/menaquinone biosynthesis C-methylase UbiE